MTSLTHKTILSALLLITMPLLTACDGINVYEVHGKLFEAENRAPLSAAQVTLTLNPDRFPSSSSNAAVTQTDGTFYISFATPTGLIFPIRPHPPTLNCIYLVYQTSATSGSVRIDLTPAMQSACPNPYTRIIQLPPTAVPLAKSQSPTTPISK